MPGDPWGRVKRAANGFLRDRGYQLQRIDSTPRAQFEQQARPFVEAHRAQTLHTVETLRERYREPVFGIVPVWSVVEMLAHVIDRVDPVLMNVSQETHVLQVLEQLTAEHADESLLLTALLHDLGKVLVLVGEDPAHVGGRNEPIGCYDAAIGLDQCVLQWNHDEFGYSRFAGRVPDHVAWLIRYHSVVPEACLHLMDDRDRGLLPAVLEGLRSRRGDVEVDPRAAPDPSRRLSVARRGRVPRAHSLLSRSLSS